MDPRQKTLRTELAELRDRLTPLREEVKDLESREKVLLRDIIPEELQCSKCKGTGKVDKTVPASQPGKFSTYETRCEDCKGRGIVKEVF